jgi:cytochrome b
MPILLIVLSSVGERLGVMNAYVIGHDGAVVFELMESSNCCYCFIVIHCTSFDAKNSVFVDARLTLRLLPGAKQKMG